jgi:bifunctional non-homologous end joining protein LigD
LRYVGRVGSGLTGAERAVLLQRLAPIRRRTAPTPALASVMAGARWVEPVLVARVKYRTWTAGHLLRHPVYQGVLDDRTADAVTLPDPPTP